MKVLIVYGISICNEVYEFSLLDLINLKHILKDFQLVILYDFLDYGF